MDQIKDFLNSVPDVAWGALITGVFLFAQQVFNGKREDRRRKDENAERDKDRTEQATQSAADRQHALDLASAERLHAVDLAAAERELRLDEIRLAQEHERLQAQEKAAQTRADLWRDERRAAHLELIALFEDALKRVDDGWQKTRRAEDDADLVEPAEKLINPLPNDVTDRLNKAVANVQIIGSSASREAATNCRAKLKSADFSIWIASFSNKASRSKYASVQKAHGACAPALKAYIETVRKDLGTDD